MSERKPVVYWAVVRPDGEVLAGNLGASSIMAIDRFVGGKGSDEQVLRFWKNHYAVNGYTVRPFHLVPVEDGDE